MSNSEWLDFLGTQPHSTPQKCDDNNIKPIDTNHDITGTTIVPLTDQGMLCVQGKDSENFLQGQLSCDVAAVTENISCLGTACSPQGRVYSSFRLMRSPQNNVENDSTFLLRMKDDITETTLTTLKKYIIFFKSEISNANDNLVGIGVFGDHSDTLIQEIFSCAPKNNNDVIFKEETIIIRTTGSNSRFECWSTPEVAKQNWRKLSKNSIIATNNSWALEDIKAGIGEVSITTIDQFIPQMLNYQATGAINFNKGCYTGQEIVARAQYIGKSKRHMIRISVTEAPRLNAGMNLIDPENGKNIAAVISAAFVNENVQQALVVVLEKITDNLTTLAVENNMFNVEILSLPYELNA